MPGLKCRTSARLFKLSGNEVRSPARWVRWILKIWASGSEFDPVRKEKNAAQNIEFMRLVTRARLQSGRTWAKETQWALAPGMRHRTAIGNGTWEGWQGLKPLLSAASVAARLKSCPFTKPITDSDQGDLDAFSLHWRWPYLFLACSLPLHSAPEAQNSLQREVTAFTEEDY